MKNDFDSLDETSMYDQGDREEITAVLEAADDVYISIDNVSYHVALRGEGMPLICLHGFGEAGDTWDKLNLPGFRLYCVDFLGHGVSDRSHNPVLYQFDTVLRHLYTLIHTLVGEEPYGIMGYSMGGRMALQYAAMYELSRLMFLVLESASAGIEDINERQERAAADEVLAPTKLRPTPLNGLKKCGQNCLFLRLSKNYHRRCSTPSKSVVSVTHRRCSPILYAAPVRA